MAGCASEKRGWGKKEKTLREIFPGRIAALDQSYLPRSLPTLDFLLARNRVANVSEFLKVYEPGDSVLALTRRARSFVMPV